jgi:hypothetical protein
MKKYLIVTMFLSVINVMAFGYVLEKKIDYKPLTASGKIPDDFSTYTIEKILGGEHNHGEEYNKMSKRNQKTFLTAVHQGIDEILRSGKVLYGDPVSNYVQDLGQKIVGNRPVLHNLMFYTLKSNVVNAFSTNQGIIFVSQGLVAQVQNEAQLAFVLAHEIGHYMERHVIIGFKERMDLMRKSGGISQKIKQLSIYSKAKEFEADRVGIELYNAAGYNLKDLYSVFDLLTFSYLPFEMKKLPLTYFNTDKLFIPKSFFKIEMPEIEPEDDEDDEEYAKSSHPNIQSRKDQLESEVKKYSSWKELSNLTPVETFEYTRSLARFEQVRNNLYEFDYIAALYNLFLLEDFADNIHHQHYTAQAWYGVMLFKSSGKFTNIARSLKKVQGEQHQMHHVLRTLNKRQLATVALRKIYDLYQKNPKDQVLKRIYNLSVKTFASDKKLKLSKFHKKTYIEIKVLESQTFTGPPPPEHSKKSNDETKENDANEDAKKEIEDGDFYLYALSDIIQDKEFLKLFDEFKQEAKDLADDEETNDQLPRSEQIKINRKNFKQQLQVGIQNVILLEPRAFATSRSNYDVLGSEKMEIKLKEAFENVQVDFMKVHKIGSKEFKNANHEIYNEKAVLMNVIGQLAEYEELQFFPVDHELIEQMRIKYQTDKIAFMVLENHHRPFKGFTSIITSIVPLISIRQRAKKMSTELTLILFDLKNYSVDGFSYIEVKGKPTSVTLEAMVYDLLKTLSLKKS